VLCPATYSYRNLFSVILNFSGWIILLLFGWGCINPFAPALEKKSDVTNMITEQQSPEDVLQNFRYAYTFKDSLLYSDVIDKAFVFEFFDPNQQPTGGLTTWGRDIDLQTTGRLFAEFDVINLIWLNTLFEESQDNIERRLVRFNLNMFGSDFNFILTGTALFTFRRDEMDNKWRIVRWKDESDL